MVCRETAKEIASALAYLHSLNILHGDLSGGNILLTSANKDPRKFTCKVGMHSSRQPCTPLKCAHVSICARTCYRCHLVDVLSYMPHMALALQVTTFMLSRSLLREAISTGTFGNVAYMMPLALDDRQKDMLT